MPNPDDTPINRRKFFRMGLGELLRPLATAAAPLEKMAHHFAKLEQSARPNVWLRPPGALAEKLFRQTCQHSGECIKACPAQCIKLGTTGHGAPYIDANTAACVVCDGLYCMAACPSGAIEPTSITDIDMGTAVWKENTCLRTNGESCTICVDHCPLGSAAIEIKNGQVAVNPLGCIGCGVCQRDCPTEPKSILVIPIAAKMAEP